MKHNFFPLALVLLASLSSSCEPDNPRVIEPEPEEEIIQIPDEHFKHALVSTNSIDANGDNIGDRDIDLNNDGEIQRSEANLIKGLILNFDYNEFGRYVDLSGIENFVNLTYFKMTGDHLFEASDKEFSYDLSKLKKLQTLYLSDLGTNNFNVLDLHGLENLTEINIIHSRPDYSVSTEEYYNPENFMEVKLEGTVNLTSMDITNSFLIIDYCQVPSLKNLNSFYLEGGEPEVFDFHCLTNLEWLNIGENRIKSLILKNSSVLDTLLSSDIGDSHFFNYPPLEYICIDDFPEEFEQIESLRDENTVVTTNCTF